MSLTQGELIKRWLVGPVRDRRSGYMRFHRNMITVYSMRRRRGYDRDWHIVAYREGFGKKFLLSSTSPLREGTRDAHDRIINTALVEGMEKEIEILPLNLVIFGDINLNTISVLDRKKYNIRLDRGRPWWREMPIHTVHEAVFSAQYGWDPTRVRYFISGYDTQEPIRAGTHPLFVCELPKKAKTVDEGYEILKPNSVRKAESLGLKVRRQGDIFLIPTHVNLMDRLTPKRSRHGCDCINCRRAEVQTQRRRRILGTDHEGSVVIEHGGLTYVSEWLMHRDHNAIRLPYGKWYIAVRNTAPLRR